MNLTEFRQKYPEYDKVPDDKLAESLYNKYYKDKMTPEQFYGQFVPVEEKAAPKEYPTSFGEAAVAPLEAGYKQYMESVERGLGAMKEAIKDPEFSMRMLPKIGRGALGALEYTGAPIIGAGRAIGEAFANPLKQAGVEPNIADFVGRFPEEAAMMTPVGKIMTRAKEANVAIETAEALRSAGLMEKGGHVLSREDWYKLPVQVPLKKTAGLEERLSTPITGQVAKEVEVPIMERAAKGTFDKTQRLYLNVADALNSGEIQPQDLQRVLKDYGMSMEEFSKAWVDTISNAGRTLGQLSYMGKRLKQVFAENPAASKIIDDYMARNPVSIGDKIWEGYRRLEGWRRGLLVTQMATAMRNMWSQAGRITLGTFDEALQQGLAAGIKGDLNREVYAGLNTFQSFWKRLSPSGRKRLQEILENNSAALEKAKLLSQPVHEVGIGGKTMQVLQWMNRAQEYFFRKMAFEARLRQNLSKAGMNFDTVNPSKIPEGMISDAVNYALEMTFSASPKGRFAKDLVDGFNKMPFLYTVQPFPRFNFANAVPFIYQHSPFGLLSALKPSTIKKLASGDVREFSKIASRAAVGTLMLNKAYELRNSKYAGEKWYEIKISEDPKTGKSKTIDTRAFAPFNFYLFLAEAMKNPEKINASEAGKALIGLNRIAGTGLVFVDLIRGDMSDEAAGDLAKRFAGQWLGGWTVPLRTPKDILSGPSDEEATIRDIQEHPLIGPTLQNIPGISQTLPEAVSPVSTEPRLTSTPVLRQLTGLSIKEKNIIQREIDQLGIKWSSVYPKTRIPAADRAVSKTMAPIMEKFGIPLLQSPQYKRMSDVRKRILVKGLIQQARNAAKQALPPDLATQVKLKGLDKDYKDLMEEMGMPVETVEKTMLFWIRQQMGEMR